MPFRFKEGDTVWIRDVSKSGHGFKIRKAVVHEVHSHQGRHPYYPFGEGYSFHSRPDLYGQNHTFWDCYPGIRVWGTREEALACRMPKDRIEAYDLAQKIHPNGRFPRIKRHGEE